MASPHLSPSNLVNASHLASSNPRRCMLPSTEEGGWGGPDQQTILVKISGAQSPVKRHTDQAAAQRGAVQCHALRNTRGSKSTAAARSGPNPYTASHHANSRQLCTALVLTSAPCRRSASSPPKTGCCPCLVPGDPWVRWLKSRSVTAAINKHLATAPSREGCAT